MATVTSSLTPLTSPWTPLRTEPSPRFIVDGYPILIPVTSIPSTVAAATFTRPTPDVSLPWAGWVIRMLTTTYTYTVTVDGTFFNSGVGGDPTSSIAVALVSDVTYFTNLTTSTNNSFSFSQTSFTASTYLNGMTMLFPTESVYSLFQISWNTGTFTGMPTNPHASSTSTSAKSSTSTSSTSTSSTSSSSNPSKGLVSKGYVDGVGAALGFVALLLLGLLIWREWTWRRTRKRPTNPLPVQRSQSQAPWPKGGPFIKDTSLGHQMSDYEVSAAVHQLLDDIKSWVSQMPLVSTSVFVKHLTDADDADRVMRVLPQLRNIQELSRDVSDRRRLRALMRGIVGLVVVESMFGNRSETRGQSGRDHWLPTDVDTSFGALESALLRQNPAARSTGPPNDEIGNISLFHGWRVSTLSFLAELYGESSTSWSADVHAVSSFYFRFLLVITDRASFHCISPPTLLYSTIVRSCI